MAEVKNRDSGLRQKWLKSRTETLGFGFTDSVYWVRFTATNPTAEDLDFILVQNYPLINHLKLFSPGTDGKFTSIEVGRVKPFDARPIRNRKFAIPLSIKAGSELTYYVRQETTSSMNIVLSVWSPESFADAAMSEYQLLMLYYGIIAVMFIYNLCLFMFIRKLEYLYYPLFILFFLLFIMGQNGTAFQYLWPNYPSWGIYFIPFSLCLLVIFAFLFTDAFLDLKKNNTRQSRILVRLILPAVFIVTALCLFLPYRYAMIISAVTAGLSVCYGIYIGMLLFIQKVRNAYFYVISWFLFLFGANLYILMTFGVLQTSFMTNWSLQIGSAFQVVLLSIALADRINIMKKDLAVLNTRLEEKVRERTAELNAAVEELETTNGLLVDAQIELWGEMKLARKIQTVLLPDNPQIPGYEILAFMSTADDVGGDYYDIINAEGMDWVAIGDVSGHGVSAGLVMMMVQTAVRVALEREPGISPSDLLELVNSAISENIKKLDEDKYMTITVLAAHRDGKFMFSGLHQDILIYRAETRIVEKVNTEGIWIGVMGDIRKPSGDHVIEMHPGDTLFLYTDGITEAWEKGTTRDNRDPDRHMFGEDRLVGILERTGEKIPGEIKGEVMKALENYQCDDDVTMVVIRRL
ncbi:MAG TPA: 7TM diverse intracellular signaling domain-containing protein [Spirochaetota bacterium]|nr:7TM diverse intracellular signaling domain-containing protein [Spirochaetota bacterium]